MLHLPLSGSEMRGLRAQLPQALRLQDPQRLHVQEAAPPLLLRGPGQRLRGQQPVAPLQLERGGQLVHDQRDHELVRAGTSKMPNKKESVLVAALTFIMVLVKRWNMARRCQ